MTAELVTQLHAHENEKHDRDEEEQIHRLRDAQAETDPVKDLREECEEERHPGEEKPEGKGRGTGGGGSTLRPAGLLELENLLAEHLETKVHVTMGDKRGKISIDFADLLDLERIYRRMAE